MWLARNYIENISREKGGKNNCASKNLIVNNLIQPNKPERVVLHLPPCGQALIL